MEYGREERGIGTGPCMHRKKRSFSSDDNQRRIEPAADTLLACVSHELSFSAIADQHTAHTAPSFSILVSQRTELSCVRQEAG